MTWGLVKDILNMLHHRPCLLQMTHGTGSILTPVGPGMLTRALSCNGWESLTGAVVVLLLQDLHLKPAQQLQCNNILKNTVELRIGAMQMFLLNCPAAPCNSHRELRACKRALLHFASSRACKCCAFYPHGMPNLISCQMQSSFSLVYGNCLVQVHSVQRRQVPGCEAGQ